MRTRSIVAVVVLALSCGAMAQEGKVGGSKNKNGCRLPASVLVACPIMSRIKLTEKQVEAVRNLEATTNKSIVTASKECERSGKKRNAYYKRRGELLSELNTKVLALLQDGQKKKLEAGKAIVAACAKRMSKVRGEHMKAMRAAGADKDKKAELRKQYQTKVQPLKGQMEKQLDEKVGERQVVAGKKAAKKVSAK